MCEERPQHVQGRRGHQVQQDVQHEEGKSESV